MDAFGGAGTGAAQARRAGRDDEAWLTPGGPINSSQAPLPVQSWRVAERLNGYFQFS